MGEKMKNLFLNILEYAALFIWVLCALTTISITFVLICVGFLSLPASLTLFILQIHNILYIPGWIYLILIIYGILFMIIFLNYIITANSNNIVKDDANDEDIPYYIEVEDKRKVYCLDF